MSSAGFPTIAVVRAIEAAMAHHQAGRLADAERLYREVLRVQPENIDALHLLGVLAGQTGHADLAIEMIERASRAQPRNPVFLENLGLAYRVAGKLEDAERVLRESLALAPANAKTWSELGRVLHALGNLTDAEFALGQAVAQQPGSAETHFNHANVLKEMGRPVEAQRSYAMALSLQPSFPECHNNHGIVLAELGRTNEAERSYRIALALRPTHALAWNNLGNLLRETGRHEEAEDCYRRTVELAPLLAEAHTHLGNSLLDLGRLNEAEQSYRRAVELDPASPRVRSNLLLFLNYVPGRGPVALLEEHRRYGALFRSAGRRAPHPNARDPERRLRIGYVSGDFREHSVATFLMPVLVHHDRGRFEITCYHNFSRADATTDRLRAQVDRWRDVYGYGDDELERCIRADGIDLLVDLSGHTAYHRLSVFARKPAPVQISYLGYPAPSGLAAMDYRITDDVADPPASADAGYSERLLRLPRPMWCYGPADCEAAVSPAEEHEGVMFGSFNYFAKLNPGVIALWSHLLARVPQARLVLTRVPGPRTAAALQERFARAGVAPERLELHGIVPRNRLRRLYAAVDIGLDPFPYAGTTTTCDALWAGVPVVTLTGETTAARSGASLLRAVGLGDLVASSTEQYVEIAAALARNVSRRIELRSQLREQMRRGPLMDAPGLAKSLEGTYREAWRRWCLSGTDDSDAAWG
jgi:predicted O-linked N-acetylglucosamine transferase (SPINDLY family)